MNAPLPFPVSAQSILLSRPMKAHSMRQTRESIKAGRVLYEYIVADSANNGRYLNEYLLVIPDRLPYKCYLTAPSLRKNFSSLFSHTQPR